MSCSWIADVIWCAKKRTQQSVELRLRERDHVIHVHQDECQISGARSAYTLVRVRTVLREVVRGEGPGLSIRQGQQLSTNEKHYLRYTRTRARTHPRSHTVYNSWQAFHQFYMNAGYSLFHLFLSRRPWKVLAFVARTRGSKKWSKTLRRYRRASKRETCKS